MPATTITPRSRPPIGRRAVKPVVAEEKTSVEEKVVVEKKVEDSLSGSSSEEAARGESSGEEEETVVLRTPPRAVVAKKAKSLTPPKPAGRPSPLSLAAVPSPAKSSSVRARKAKSVDPLVEALDEVISLYNSCNTADKAAFLRVLITKGERDSTTSTLRSLCEAIGSIKTAMSGDKFVSRVYEEILPFLTGADFGVVYVCTKDGKKNVWKPTEERVIDRLPCLKDNLVSNKVVLQGLMKIYLANQPKQKSTGKGLPTVSATEDMLEHLTHALKDKDETSKKNLTPNKNGTVKTKKAFTPAAIPANMATQLLNFYLCPEKLLTADDKSLTSEYSEQVKKEMEFITTQVKYRDALKKTIKK